MDIYMYNSTFSSRLAYSADDNIATGDPYEIISYTNNTGASQAINILLVHYAGPLPGFMKYVCWTNINPM